MKSLQERNNWLTEIAHRALDGFATVSSAAKIRVAAAAEDIYQQHISSDALRAVLRRGVIKGEGAAVPDMSTIAKAMTSRTLANGERVLAAACIVLAHSLLDDILTDGCLLAIECDSQGWSAEINPARTVTVRDLRARREAGVLAEELEKLGGQLKNKSLPSRAEVFFRRVHIAQRRDIQKTEPSYFRLSTLQELDELRHGLIHRGELKNLDAAQTSDRVWFFQETANTVVRSLAYNYDLAVDRDTLMKLFGVNAAGGSRKGG